jgi:hypothetical protein
MNTTDDLMELAFTYAVSYAQDDFPDRDNAQNTLSAAIDQLVAERDALRAEVEGWMKDNSAGGWIYELRVNQSQARKDAERWRWARTHPAWLGWDDDCPEEIADEEIDAAIRKGEA